MLRGMPSSLQRATSSAKPGLMTACSWTKRAISSSRSLGRQPNSLARHSLPTISPASRIGSKRLQSSRAKASSN